MPNLPGRARTSTWRRSAGCWLFSSWPWKDGSLIVQLKNLPMAEQPGHNILRSLQRQWKWQGLLYCLLLALAGSLLATVLLVRWLAFSPWMGLPVFVVFFLLALIFFPYWRISLADTARFLNERVPELEESCGLLLLPRSSLGSLERLQADRTAGRLGLL